MYLGTTLWKYYYLLFCWLTHEFFGRVKDLPVVPPSYLMQLVFMNVYFSVSGTMDKNFQKILDKIREQEDKGVKTRNLREEIIQANLLL